MIGRNKLSSEAFIGENLKGGIADSDMEQSAPGLDGTCSLLGGTDGAQPTLMKNMYLIIPRLNKILHFYLGPYALFLQAFIGFVALSSLIYKRAVLDELPRRPFNIWFMDVSKQCFSSVLVHFFNIGISIMLSQVSIAEKNSGGKIGDQCANYLMNFIMGTFLASY